MHIMYHDQKKFPMYGCNQTNWRQLLYLYHAYKHAKNHLPFCEIVPAYLCAFLHRGIIVFMKHDKHHIYYD